MSRRLTAAAACLCIAALPLAGCGSKKKGIPRADVAQIVALLKDARKQAGAKTPGECNALFTTIQGLGTRVKALPSDVDSNVRDSLTNGIGNLQNLAAKQCSQTQTTTTQTQTTPTTPTQTTPTQTTPTQTTPTQTTPTTPTQTNTTPTTTAPPSGGTTAPGAPTPP